MDNQDQVIELLRDIRALLAADLDLCLTEEEAARLLRCSPRFLQNVRAKGRIGFSVLHGEGDKQGKVRYTRDDLIRFLARNKFNPDA